MRAIQLGKWPSTLAGTESPDALWKRLVPETDSQRFPFNWSQEQPGSLGILEGHQVFLPVQPRLRTTWPGFIIYNHLAETQVQLLWSVSSCVFVESPEQTCTDIRGQAPCQPPFCYERWAHCPDCTSSSCGPSVGPGESSDLLAMSLISLIVPLSGHVGYMISQRGSHDLFMG